MHQVADNLPESETPHRQQTWSVLTPAHKFMTMMMNFDKNNNNINNKIHDNDDDVDDDVDDTNNNHHSQRRSLQRTAMSKTPLSSLWSSKLG